MTVKPSKTSVFALVAVLAAVAPALAQAPDCSGVSAAIPSNDDYLGELSSLRLATGLSSPVLVTAAPGDPDRLFIVERAGVIKIFKDGAVSGTPFINLDPIVNGSAAGGSTSETGLLGLAFHPDYQNNGFFYVFYTSNAIQMIVSRYTRSTPDLADSGSAKQILVLPQPFTNHNGGTIAFGPDGYLYVGTGDGGSGCDPGNRAQDTTAQLLGKMLRIDVDVDPGAYLIPSDNPFVGVTGDDEIWQYGLRNPFRFTFDRLTGAMMIGDVGQNQREEVDCVPAGSIGGENFGWKNVEGTLCGTCGGGGSCTPTNYVPPILTYQTTNGHSVISGYIYRGCRMPELNGTYFYGNYNWNNGASDGFMFVRSFRVDTDTCAMTSTNIDRHQDLKETGFLYQRIAGFGEDNRGEMYFVDQFDGELYKIVPEFSILEISGPGAQSLIMGTDWTWEDLEASSGRDVAIYKVYRSDSANGLFECAIRNNNPIWPGGDPDVPVSGSAFYYLVTALSAGQETSPGLATDGTPRNTDTTSFCSAP